jgi:hypothetical protein
MNRDDIIRMADEAQLIAVMEMFQDELINFAALVAAAEREACAKVCMEEAPSLDGQLCAAAIRKRGEK